MSLSRLLSHNRLLTGFALLMAFSTHAEEISFRLSAEHSRLSITLLGDGAAYYPSVFQIDPNGRWQQLVRPPGAEAQSQLNPQESMEMLWPESTDPARLDLLGSTQPVMIRFFDKNGAGFGQISFFQPPAQRGELVDARYINHLLKVRVDPKRAATIHSTWVLWPHENGISALLEPLRVEQAQPGAVRVNWQSDGNEVALFTGKGEPPAVLIHETDHGAVMQVVAGGLLGPHQRFIWINESPKLYFLAFALMAAAVVGFMAYFVQTFRRPIP